MVLLDFFQVLGNSREFSSFTGIFEEVRPPFYLPLTSLMPPSMPEAQVRSQGGVEEGNDRSEEAHVALLNFF